MPIFPHPLAHSQDLLDEAPAESFPASAPISPYIARISADATGVDDAFTYEFI